MYLLKYSLFGYLLIYIYIPALATQHLHMKMCYASMFTHTIEKLSTLSNRVFLQLGLDCIHLQ